MIRAITERLARSRQSQKGFTLIELLVVIIVLGVLSAVVVFAVRGTGDKGRASAMGIDARTIRTAQETYCANKGRYGSAEELVAGKYLSEMPTYHQTDTVAAGTPDAAGNCQGAGDLTRASFVITCDETQQGCGGGGALKLGWRAQSPPAGFTRFLNDVAFVDNQRGWAVGGTPGSGGSKILRTQDGGTTWTEVPGVPLVPFGQAFRRIDCLNATRCWVVGDEATIVRTTDGTNWTASNPIPAPADGTYFFGVHFLDAMNGWAVGDDAIIRTTDGGLNWTVVYTGTAGGTQVSLYQIEFTDAANGWAVGNRSDTGEGIVLRTTTGGGSQAAWSMVTLADTAPRDIGFFDNLRGWWVGVGGTNDTTVDGGATWIQQPKMCGDSLSADFVNPRQGWSATNTGCAVNATTDGSKSWTVQATIAQLGGLEGIDMVDAAHGWAVGRGGRIRKYGPVP